MTNLPATDLAIAMALRSGNLRIEEITTRFGDIAIAICDAAGLIEIADSGRAAEARISDVAGRMGG